MPFPFIPAGAALALAVLGGAFTLFWLLVRLLDRTATSARDAALSARDAVAPGLVAGLRTWGRGAGEGAGEGAGAVAAGRSADHSDHSDGVRGEGDRPGDLAWPGSAGLRARRRDMETGEDEGAPTEAEDLPAGDGVPTEPVPRG
jgi:hypothetical protein